MRGALALAMLVGASAPAAAHWENTRWGMSEAQVMASTRNAYRALPADQRLALPRARMEYRVAGEVTRNGIRYVVAFAFDGHTGGLVCVSARTEPAHADALRTRYERLFGRPAERGRDPRSGMQTLGWARPDEIDMQIAPSGTAVILHCARGV